MRLWQDRTGAAPMFLLFPHLNTSLQRPKAGFTGLHGSSGHLTDQRFARSSHWGLQGAWAAPPPPGPSSESCKTLASLGPGVHLRKAPDSIPASPTTLWPFPALGWPLGGKEKAGRNSCPAAHQWAQHEGQRLVLRPLPDPAGLLLSCPPPAPVLSWTARPSVTSIPSEQSTAPCSPTAEPWNLCQCPAPPRHAGSLRTGLGSPRTPSDHHLGWRVSIQWISVEGGAQEGWRSRRLSQEQKEQLGWALFKSSVLDRTESTTAGSTRLLTHAEHLRQNLTREGAP